MLEKIKEEIERITLEDFNEYDFLKEIYKILDKYLG